MQQEVFLLYLNDNLHDIYATLTSAILAGAGRFLYKDTRWVGNEEEGFVLEEKRAAGWKATDYRVEVWQLR